MKTILYMAMSADGFIAGPDDETPWSDDEWSAFKEFVSGCGVVLLGRRTYQIMQGGGEFVPGPEYIVVTNDGTFDASGLRTMSIKTKHDMPAAGRVGVIGGGELNGNLAMLGVLDEIILDIEPVLLGAGKRLFGGRAIDLPIEQVASRRIGAATVQNHYKVVR